MAVGCIGVISILYQVPVYFPICERFHRVHPRTVLQCYLNL